MKTFKTIAGYNLLAILLYSILVRFLSPRQDDGVIIIYSAILVCLHVMVCVLVCLMYAFDRNKEYARAWIASAGIALLVGFSACLGNAAI